MATCLTLAVLTLLPEVASAINIVTIDDALVKVVAEVRVPAIEAGQLIELSHREGATVRTGQVIGQMNDSLVVIDQEVAELEHRIALEKSDNDIDERFARKSLAVAQSELTLSQNAVRRVPDSISKTELDRLQLVVEQSTLSIEQAQRERAIAQLTRQLKERTIAAAKARVERRQIKAPVNGVIVEVMAQPGEWLAPGDPVVRIIRMDRLRVEVSVDGTRFGSELTGCKVKLAVTVPPDQRSEIFTGVVTFVNPEVQAVNGKVRVWAEVDNRNGVLRPGVHGTLTIDTATAPASHANSE